MFCALFETRNLSNHILSMVDDTQKCLFDSILELGVLNPLAQFAPPETNLAELFKFDLFHNLAVVVLMIISCQLFALLSSRIMYCLRTSMVSVTLIFI